MAEIDNAMYAFGLSEALRRRVEDAGRVTLNDNERGSLAVSKELHIFFVVILVVSEVWSFGNIMPRQT